MSRKPGPFTKTDVYRRSTIAAEAGENLGNLAYPGRVTEHGCGRGREGGNFCRQQIAEAVGVGAVVFSALKYEKTKDVVFDLDNALNFDGETSPYIQYTHARCCSIIKKCNFAEDS